MSAQMIRLSKLFEAEEAILLGLFAMGTRARMRLFEYGNARTM
jgi:hypothetical protein